MKQTGSDFEEKKNIHTGEYISCHDGNPANVDKRWQEICWKSLAAANKSCSIINFDKCNVVRVRTSKINVHVVSFHLAEQTSPTFYVTCPTATTIYAGNVARQQAICLFMHSYKKYKRIVIVNRQTRQSRYGSFVLIGISQIMQYLLKKNCTTSCYLLFHSCRSLLLLENSTCFPFVPCVP